MQLREVALRLGAEELVRPATPDVEIRSAAAADLLSDILATGKDEFVILTGLVSPQVIRTAQVVGALAIFLVRGKHPTQEMIGLAQAHGIPLYTTPLALFESCVRLAPLVEER
ncbi:MAG: hypothetical protein GX774_00690 [Armatimonadetes bacterium]|jgi:hypothetical protein|nr:hypothetical protein [Armatimonadota bacterium]